MRINHQRVSVAAFPSAPVRLSRRALAESFLLALVWPFLAAVIQVKNFTRYRLLAGFVLFCGFAGFVLIPTPGSDAHAYMMRFEAVRLGFSSAGGEPVPAALMRAVAWLDLNVSWYFGILGLLYGVVVAWSARLLFQNLPRDAVLGLVTIVFLGAFFLNHPVFSAVNARYHLGLWVLLASTLLMLDGRWKQALAVAVLGTMIHFGHVLFSFGLAVLLLSRLLGSWQIFFAYAALAIALVVPPTAYGEIGSWVSQNVGGDFGDKVAFSVRYAESTEFGMATRENEVPWFLLWYSTPVFSSLLITGHFLVWKIINKREDPQYQLWILIILMWALQLAIGGEPEAASRVQRNTTALLLLWHARWFLVRKDGARIAILINALPVLFYFVVAYRRWFHQANVGAFLPTPFGIWPDLWPTVMGILGFD